MKQINIKITHKEHKIIKIKAAERGISIKQLILMAIKTINGGEDGKV